MPPDSPAPETASITSVAAPKNTRRRRSPEERIAELDARIASLRAQASRTRRRAETARLLGLGRAASAALGDADPADLARLIVWGRWASSGLKRSAVLEKLDAWATAPADREILGLAPRPGGASAAGSPLKHGS